MDAQNFKDKLSDLDAKTKDIRVERWSELKPAVFDTNLPALIWRYLTEADDMYVSGYFIGVILLCAGVLEVVLADQIASRLNIDEKESSSFEMQQHIILGHRLGMLTDTEAFKLDEFRLLRNGLIHGNSGKIAQMSRKLYHDDRYYDVPTVETYLNPATGNGINSDALHFLNMMREITVRFYGEKTTEKQAVSAVETKS